MRHVTQEECSVLSVMCPPQTIPFAACLGFSHPVRPTSKLRSLERGWPLRRFWVAKDTKPLWYPAPVTEENQVSLICNFEIELSDQNAEAGKGQWRKPSQVEY